MNIYTHTLSTTTLSPPSLAPRSTTSTSNCFANRYHRVEQLNYATNRRRQGSRNSNFQALTLANLPPALQAFPSLLREASLHIVVQSLLPPAVFLRKRDSCQLYLSLEEGLRDLLGRRSSANHLWTNTGIGFSGLAHQQQWWGGIQRWRGCGPWWRLFEEKRRDL